LRKKGHDALKFRLHLHWRLQADFDKLIIEWSNAAAEGSFRTSSCEFPFKLARGVGLSESDEFICVLSREP
jgi:hypothetical protein